MKEASQCGEGVELCSPICVPFARQIQAVGSQNPKLFCPQTSHENATPVPSADSDLSDLFLI